jgi:hypothetical protein
MAVMPVHAILKGGAWFNTWRGRADATGVWTDGQHGGAGLRKR